MSTTVAKLPAASPATVAQRTRDPGPRSSTHTTPHHSPSKALFPTSHSPDSRRRQYSSLPSQHFQPVYYSAPSANAQPPPPRARDRHQPATAQTLHHRAAPLCRYHAKLLSTSAQSAG